MNRRDAHLNHISAVNNDEDMDTNIVKQFQKHAKGKLAGLDPCMHRFSWSFQELHACHLQASTVSLEANFKAISCSFKLLFPPLALISDNQLAEFAVC